MTAHCHRHTEYICAFLCITIWRTHACARSLLILSKIMLEINTVYAITIMTLIYYMMRQRTRMSHVNSKIHVLFILSYAKLKKCKGLSFRNLNLLVSSAFQCRVLWKSNQEAKHYCLYDLIFLKFQPLRVVLVSLQIMCPGRYLDLHQ